MATQDEFDLDPITGLPKQKQPPAADGVGTSRTPPSATSLGAAYVKQVQDRLAGNDQVVKNAQQHNQHAKAVQQYLAGTRAREASVRAGYDPGTLQYQRTMDRENRTANDAGRAADHALNDLVRTRSAEAMTMARGLEQDEQKAISDLINSLTDNPVAQNYLRRVHAAGGDVRGAYESMFAGSTGSGGGAGSSGGEGGDTTGGNGTGGGIQPGALRDEFRPQTEAEKALEGIKDELRVGGFEGDLDAEALRIYNQRQSDKNAEADAARKKTLLEDAQRIVASLGFDQLTPEQREAFLGNVPMREASALPTGSAVRDLLEGDLAGQFVKVGGVPYQIMDAYRQVRWDRSGGYSDRHHEWTVVKDLNTGATKYIRSDGVIVDYKPPAAPKGMKITWNAEKGVFEERYGNSGGRTGKVYDPSRGKWVKK